MGCLVALFSGLFLMAILWAFSVNTGLGILLVLAFIGLLVWVTHHDNKRKAEQKESDLNQIQSGFEKVKDSFTTSQSYTSMDDKTAIAIDEGRKLICLVRGNISKIYTYRDLLESEIIEDGIQVTKTSRTSQVGGALLGGVLAGGVGAIIGGLSGSKTSTEEVMRIDLKIIVNDTNEPIFSVNMLFADVSDFDGKPIPIKKADTRYKSGMETAQHWHGLISVLIRRADDDDKEKGVTVNTPAMSLADELAKLFELLKQGIITQEEFDKQKAKLLG